MDRIDRDALKETEDVLRDLAGYLLAVEHTQKGHAHHSLTAIAGMISEIAEIIPALEYRSSTTYQDQPDAITFLSDWRASCLSDGRRSRVAG